MAIPNNYIDKITNKDSGESRIISPAADMVRVENENYEGADLDEVLDEISDAFSEIEQHGLVNGRVPFDEATPVVLASLDGDNTDITPYSEGDYFAVLSSEKIYQVENGAADEVGEIDDKLIYCDKATGNLYRWDYTTNQFVQVGGNSGGGDGTVTGVKVGSTTYEPTEGVVDISPAIPDTSGLATKTEVTQGLAGKVDKVTGYGLSKNDYSDTDKTKLAGIAAGAQVNVISGIKANGASETLPVENGIVTLPPASAGGLTEEDISVSSNQDGTFDINVGEDTYTIDLNHTHEHMAKLVVDTAANLPDASDMENDTIYGELDDGEIATIYIGGYPFYGGGGGASSGPVLRRPSDGSTIDMGETVNGSVSKTINVKGKNLTQALTIELDGTGYAFGNTQPSGVTIVSTTELTVTAAAANTLNGVDIVVVYTGTDTDENASGTLGITSASPDSISTETTLVANKVTYENLTAIKLTGTQWLQTDYKPNANTKVTMRLKFSTNSHTVAGNTNNKNFYFFACPVSNNNYFTFYAYEPAADNYQILGVCPAAPAASISPVAGFLTDDSTFEVGLGSFSFTPNGGSKKSQSTTGQTASMDSCIEIGHYYRGVDQLDTIFNWFDLTIYELTISENNVTKRHYVPKKKKRDNVPGLYDTENGTFISSKTSTELVEIPLT